MASNRAILNDLLELGLDPTKHHFSGKNGRLVEISADECAEKIVSVHEDVSVESKKVEKITDVSKTETKVEPKNALVEVKKTGKKTKKQEP